jgi:hypothetical protein
MSLPLRTLLGLSYLLFGWIYAQNVAPDLPTQGSTLEALIPAGYRLLDHTAGDLNQDGRPDLALVTQGTDSTRREAPPAPGMDSLDLNPRRLAIYFQQPDSSYRLVAQADQFIPLRESLNMDDPFDGVGVTPRGVLQIDLHYFYSMGSWTTSDHSYKFRYQNERFELIGYDSNELHRGSGEVNSFSFNFSTRKMSRTTGSLVEGKPTETTWDRFELERLKSLQELEKPFNWSFMGTRI